jgi:hypothetical protein
LDSFTSPLRVEKTRFTLLLANFTALSADEAKELVSLTEQFPYSQLIRTLAARAAWDTLPESKQDQLKLAALCVPDRALLREVIERPRTVRPPLQVEPAVRVAQAPGVPGIPERVVQPIPETRPDSRTGDQIRKELISDLHELSRLMKRFETQAERVEMLSHAAATSHSKKEPKALPEQQARKAESTKEASSAKDPGQDKKQRKEEKKAEKKRRKEEKAATEPLLQEIKKSKPKVEPSGKKRKAQREIIDRFIKVQPSIAKPVFTDAPGVDLSEASTAFSDQIISETLVEILIKQGKREKAIEVLKKLIWKIPQKKATFAAKIEELKRS